MSEQRDDGGPAFPEGDHVLATGGMTLRDYFAAMAMQPMVTMSEGYTGNVEGQIKPMVSDAYAWADAMIKERAK